MKLTSRSRILEGAINSIPDALPREKRLRIPYIQSSHVQSYQAEGQHPDGRRLAAEYTHNTTHDLPEFMGLSNINEAHIAGNGIEAIQTGVQIIDSSLIMRLLKVFEENHGFSTGIDMDDIYDRLTQLKGGIITDTLAQAQTLPGGLRIGGTSLRGTRSGVKDQYEAAFETPILAQGMAEKDYNLLKGSNAIKNDGEILEGKKNSPVVVDKNGQTIDFDQKDPAQLAVQLLLGAWITAHTIPYANSIDDARLYGEIGQTSDSVRAMGVITARPHHTSPDVVTSTNWSTWTKMQMAIRESQREEAKYLIGNTSRPDLEFSCGPEALEHGASYYTAVATLEAGLRASALAHPDVAPKFIIVGTGGVSMEMIQYALYDRSPQLTANQFVVFNPYASDKEIAELAELGVEYKNADFTAHMNQQYFSQNAITAVLDNSPGRQVRPEHLMAMGDHKLVLMGAANALIDPEHARDAMQIIKEKDIFYVNDTFTNAGGVYFALIDMALRTLFKDGVPADLKPKIHQWIMDTLVGMTHKNIDEANRREGSFSQTNVAMIDERQRAMYERKTAQYERYQSLIADGQSVQAVSELLERLHIPNVVGDELWNLVADHLPGVQRDLTAQGIQEIIETQ